MDLNLLFRRHQISLMIADRGLTRDERQAHAQFASDYAGQIRHTRDSLGARRALPGSVT